MMPMKNFYFPIIMIAIGCLGCVPKKQVQISNPIMNGYYADPSMVRYEGKYYIYATIDLGEAMN